MTQCHDFSCALPAQVAAHPAPDPVLSAAAQAAPVIDFFHDVVCGWCYVMSPRLRQVTRELGLRVRQRSFVLQASRAEMVARFGSMEQAKQTILGHWEACAQHDDTQRIDIEGMRRESFEYPSGLAGALACQAAQMLEGDEAHWNLFDAIQHAHMSAHRNIGDAEVLLKREQFMLRGRGVICLEHSAASADAELEQQTRAVLERQVEVVQK